MSSSSFKKKSPFSSDKGAPSDQDQLESSFLKCLHEIELAYVHLSKPQRLRVEKWIEKLVGTGRNPVWRRHRNSYARLLLSMVVTRSLTEPFSLLPPDGPLPSFPAHVKSSSRDLVGAREISFWRGIYDRMQDNHKENNSHGNAWLDDNLNTSNVNNNNSNNKARARFGEGIGLTREFENMNLLVREQNERILLLEQQLHDERMQHELRLQRLHYTHRTEINKLLAELGRPLATEFALSSSLESTVNRQVPSSFRARAPSSSLFAEDRDATHAYEARRELREPPHMNREENTFLDLRTSTPFAHVFEARSDPLSRPLGALNLRENMASDSFSRPPPPPTPSQEPIFLHDRSKPSILNQDLSSQHIDDDLSQTVDIRPWPRTENANYNESQSLLAQNKISFESSADVIPRPIEQPHDDDFLDYLDKFQNELSRAQAIDISGAEY